MAAPDQTLFIPLPLWWRLIRQLRRRGRGITESGAFILGRLEDRGARAHSIMLYDDIDPMALSSGIVRLSGQAMNAVWETCAREGIEVLADVHTHPSDARQSRSDQEHPMVATHGHIALIIPNLALSAFDLGGVGHYRYQGSKRWRAFEPPRLGFFNIQFRGGR